MEHPEKPDYAGFEEYLNATFSAAEAGDLGALHILENFAVELEWGEMVSALALCCWNEACKYRDGEGVPRDERKARELTLRAAENGYAQAQYEIGRLYVNGEGVPQDFAEAAKWFQLAADQNLAWAQCNLGILYMSGQGIERDWLKAIRLWELSAEQGHDVSQFNLGLWYADMQDFEEAGEYFRRAAAQGHRKAAERLDSLYATGKLARQ